MGRARDAIMNGTFPDYLRSFFAEYFWEHGYPEWCVNALRSVGVELMDSTSATVAGSGARWDKSDVHESKQNNID
jgi:queuine tRNA-ribosyltransferase